MSVDGSQINPSEPAEPPPAAPLRRYKLIVAYDGSDFHGWQKQEPPPAPDGTPTPPLRTVQGVLEDAVRRVVGDRAVVVGASRTDAGVHAMGQTAMFDAATRIPTERLAEAINSRLPKDVEVRHAEEAPLDFAVISGATSKQYRYRIWNSTHRPLGLRRLVYHFWHPLDVERMNEAAQRLVGTHDFASLASKDHNRETTVRTIHHCYVEKPPAHEPEVHVVVASNGFLYNMVRIIVGTLIEVGRGRWSPEEIDRILAARDRQAAGPTAPAEGLVLEWVRYD